MGGAVVTAWLISLPIFREITYTSALSGPNDSLPQTYRKKQKQVSRKRYIGQMLEAALWIKTSVPENSSNAREGGIGQINRWHLHTVEYYVALKRVCSTMGNLQGLGASDRSQMQTTLSRESILMRYKNRQWAVMGIGSVCESGSGK